MELKIAIYSHFLIEVMNVKEKDMNTWKTISRFELYWWRIKRNSWGESNNFFLLH